MSLTRQSLVRQGRWLLLAATVAGAARGDNAPIRVEAADLGFVIVGTIVQPAGEDSVALLKHKSGTVQAVKRDVIIDGRYKVLAVYTTALELLSKDQKRYLAFRDKFEAALPTRDTTQSTVPSAPTEGEVFKEDGFERNKGRIMMTALYRDKLLKDDLARILMQATAEPYLEGNAIVGFKITQIDAGSIYAKSGIQNDDIVTAVNGTELTTVAGTVSLLQSLRGATHVELDVRRAGTSQHLTIDVNN